MIYRLKQLLYNHFKNRILLYFIVLICLMVGISAGAITIKVLDANQKKELISFLDSFFKILNEDNKINSYLLLKHSLTNNLQTILSIWLLGITIIGLPVLFAIVILRGFIIGFTVGFLTSEIGIKGILFVICAILPQNIFIIPGLVIISVISVNFSKLVISKKIKKARRYNLGKELIYHTLAIIAFSLLIIIGSLVEAYITPVFMKLILGYVI
ncbi:stage II sporulation protein M [Thermohalobacter berrensis]|uniref:Stage II sporulation protein M n=1 Tax=Thermohalobacter berrensis TaxID=99594 RepID=A0A419TAS3_9FIRM|nr:stage II sporulation protein M [Thermohalobacter berrensis]RKD34552.1 stage II sporulation protein M [Thermohalobacter berrensis]